MAARPSIRLKVDPSDDPGSTTFEDAALIEKIRAGQVECYGELVLKYQDRIFNTCWRITGNLEDARDLTQEAFLRAYERLDGFKQQSGFYTWLFRVAVNLSLTYRRTAKRRRVVSFGQLSAGEGTQAENLARQVERHGAEDPMARADQADLQARVASALHELDDDHRAVVVLRDMEGFDYRQIAEILAIPPGTVRSRLHRARAALREAVGLKGESE